MDEAADTKRSGTPKLGVSKTIKKTRVKDSDSKDAKDAMKGKMKQEVTGADSVAKSEENSEIPSVGATNDSFAAEYDVKHPSGDTMRDKVRGLLKKALCTGDPNAKDAEIVAAAIEQAMFDKFEGNGPPYKSKYRELSFNLKDVKNKKLRETVLGRELAPSVLITMTSEELANDELKKTREKVVEKFTRDAQPYNNQAASTDEFKCGKCKQRKCTYYQAQTRSADEPMTTFVQCVNCGNRWRF